MTIELSWRNRTSRLLGSVPSQEQLFYCDVKKNCPQADGDEPAGDRAMSLLETGPRSCLSSFPLKKTLYPFSVVVSPKFFLRISQSPRMFYLYLSISCISSLSFPAALSVLVFHVPMVMFSLSRIFDDAPVACLTPPPGCTAEGAVLVDPGGDRSDMVWLCVVIA